MSLPKLSRGFVQQLLRLLDGETVNASAFGNRKLLKRLEDDRVVFRIPSGRNRAVYRCSEPDALRNHLKLQFGIVDLQAYLVLLDQDVRDGEESLKATTSTKTLRTGSLQGFFIKAFHVELRIGEHPLAMLPEGVDYFVHQPDALSLAETVTVVGVENPECFTKAERLLHLFPERELVFVLRYHSNRLIQWLESIANPYLHFGDFDPAGIAIYCNEYLARLGDRRCCFFVPEQIEKLLEQNGSRELFDQQAHLWPPKGDGVQSDLLRLIRLISRTGKGAEQELLLKEIFSMKTDFAKDLYE
jgi:hypothetical protein